MSKLARVLPGATLLVVLVCLGVAVAGAVEAGNEGCLACHEPSVADPVFRPVAFDVAAVDYSSCNACHWIGMGDKIGDRWAHAHLVIDPLTECEECHLVQGYPSETDVFTPTFLTGFGYFDEPTSLATSFEDIHAIHIGGSWPAETRFRPNYCASCHAAAACDACHVDASEHGAHTDGSAVYPPETYLQASGTPSGDPDVLTAQSRLVTCTNDTCHPRSLATGASFVPSCLACHAADGEQHAAVHEVADQLNRGCRTCHGTTLDSIHAKVGLGCDACHASSDPIVIDAIAASATGCVDCHGAVRHFGRR